MANFPDICPKLVYFFDFIRRIPNLYLKSTYFLTHKTKKTNKIEKIRWSCLLATKISIPLEYEYYQIEKTVQIRKMYDNFHFFVQILVKIIINLLDFQVFPIYVIVIFNLDR